MDIAASEHYIEYDIYDDSVQHDGDETCMQCQTFRYLLQTKHLHLH